MNTYIIKGMTCQGCVSSIKKAFSDGLPAAEVEVVLESGQLQVNGEHEAAEIEKIVEDAGFDFAGAL